MAETVRLALVWHMHQPSYRDALSNQVVLPWTRLHATKDYGDMVTALRREPRVHATFNITPILLDQLDALAAGASDLYLDLARKPAESLSPEEQRFITRHFFSVNPVRMIEPHPRYLELRARAARTIPGARSRIQPPLLPQEIRDLETWFHLAWVDPEYQEEEPIRSLRRKGSGFTEEEKRSLLDWGVACASRITGAYRDAMESGQVELTTSAYYHPILPLLIDSDAPREISPSIPLPMPAFRAPSDAHEQLRRARQEHWRRFGRTPRGTWPPEGAVDDASLALLCAAGFEWAASDETVLARALGRDEPGGRDWPALLYRPYIATTAAGPIAMVFRDRALSDLIGFTYQAWDAERAADDFVARVVQAGVMARAAGEARPLVAVILDGENCWEAYPEDGRRFLAAFYAAIAGEARIEALTVSEALDQDPPQHTLAHVPVGSWIRSDLGIWIGHPEKNRAWMELSRARVELERAREGGQTGARPLEEAHEEILAAEASDWFWWYGDDHTSAHREELDALFRSHLIRCYSLLGRPVPASVRRSLRAAPAEALEAERLPYIRPRLDGRDTHFYEWLNAQLFDPAAEYGADHRVDARLKRVFFGFWEADFFIRVDGATPESLSQGSLALKFQLPREATARVPLGGARSGGLDWGAPVSGDAGEFALGTLLEIRVPFHRLGVLPGSVLRWRIELEIAGAAVEIAPRGGPLSTPVPDAEFELRNWSAT